MSEKPKKKKGKKRTTSITSTTSATKTLAPKTTTPSITQPTASATTQKKKTELFPEEDADSPELVSGTLAKLRVNPHFKQVYEQKKRRAELAKLQAEVGDEDSYGSEEEDSDAEALTPELDFQILETIRLIRNKEPEVYDKSTRFFAPAADGDEAVTLSLGATPAISPARGSVSQTPGSTGNKSNAGVSQHEKDSKDLKRAFWDAVEESEKIEGGDDLLRKRSLTAEEREAEENSFQDFLKKRAAQREKKPLSDTEVLERYFGATEKLTPDEAFLRDYVLNRRWIDSSTSRVPTYEQIVDSDPSEDEDREQFERAYNFRFEEPGGTEIIGHAREHNDTLRRKDDSRKQAREKRKARKKAEMSALEKKRLELAELKKAEVAEKLRAITTVAGKDLPLHATDLEEDFDPEAYDRMMSQIFNDDYDKEGDDEDPRLLGLEGLLDDEDFDFEADDVDLESATAGSKRKGKRRKDKKAAADEAADLSHQSKKRRKEEKPAPPPPAAAAASQTRRLPGGAARIKADDDEVIEKAERALESGEQTSDQAEILRKYIADYRTAESLQVDESMPFRYSSVTPNTFGLAPEEILLLPTRDLNQWVSLKKLAPYRDSEWRIPNSRSKWWQPPKWEEPAAAEQDSKHTKKSKKHKKDKKKSEKKKKKKQKNENSEPPHTDESKISKKEKKKKLKTEKQPKDNAGAGSKRSHPSSSTTQTSTTATSSSSKRARS